ncbi:hypothetical protein BGX38DRAFT_1333844 [Terfezia claveryi]|nr:hypothetical protein BGX38DRAFT_1333844 [Terfezia claveryi]
MYDPARDTFVTEDAPPSSSPIQSQALSHDQHHSSPHPPPQLSSPTFAPPPPLNLNFNHPQAHPTATPTSAPTPGGVQTNPQPLSSLAEMNISFDFQKPASSSAGTAPTPGRRMSKIDDLLSPAPGGGQADGGYVSSNAPNEQAQQKPAEDGKRKLPSFNKRKRDAAGDGMVGGPQDDGRRVAPAYRVRDRDGGRGGERGERGDRDRDGGRGGERGERGDNRRFDRERDREREREGGRDGYRDRDRGERFDRDRNRPPPRRRSRSPPRRDGRDGRSTGADTYRPCSRTPPPPTTSTSTSKFPPRPSSPLAHLRLLSSLPREPSPPPPPRSPPRATRRRPGAACRLTDSEREAARVLQEKRDAEEAARKKAESDPNANLAVEDVVRSHYNERPEMGKVWRVESSRIKGLRALNNWIKSCIIHKFSPSPGVVGGIGGARYGGVEDERLYVLDVGCGKGGDLRKWKLAPQEVGMYVGVDNAEVSIAQARDRYESMLYENRPPPRGGYNRRPPPEDHHYVPCIREIGYDASVTPAGIRGGAGRWATGGGFDVVSMMFCLHYAFESEAKARRMLANVSGALKKGGRFVGTIPSSDVIKEKLGGWVKEQEEKQHKGHEVGVEKEVEQKKDGEGGREFSWGNGIYKVTFPESTIARIIPPCSQPPSAPAPPQPAQQPTTTTTPHRGSSSPPYVPGGLVPTTATPPKHTWDNRFRPPFGWRYQYHLDEAVEGVPEYIVPWESFRALCEEFNLELVYKRGFHDIWREESRGGELGRLSERMGVREGRWRGAGGGGGSGGGGGGDGTGGNGSLKEREGGLELTEEEWEACGFYVAFAFRKS